MFSQFLNLNDIHMHLERNPAVCVRACVHVCVCERDFNIQSWILGHVKVVIISQKVILQMEQRVYV